MSNSMTPTERYESCDHETWTRVGVSSVPGAELRVLWECADCPAWTTEVKGNQYHVGWTQTPMDGGQSE